MPSPEAARLAEYASAVRASSLQRLRAVPAGSENWRFRQGAMSFADLARHLIDADEWLFEKLENEALEPMVGRVGLANVETREQYEALLDELVDTGERRRQWLAGLTEDDLMRKVLDGRFGGEVTVWWVVVRGNLDHEAHHRGQLATWLAALEESTPTPGRGVLV